MVTEIFGLAAVKAFTMACIVATFLASLFANSVMLSDAACAGPTSEITRAAGTATAKALLIRLILIDIRPPEIAEGLEIESFQLLALI